VFDHNIDIDAEILSNLVSRIGWHNTNYVT
ncbi:uncharacterized protein METZ01_LOCUS426203, partial [marine metagenome]